MTNSETFNAWALFVVDIEKPYVNDPTDSGGETFYGFTWPFLNDHNATPPRTEREAVGLLYRTIWEPNHCDEFNWLVGWCYGDAIVHHGKYAATKCLQAGLGVAQDGKFGPITLAAAKAETNTARFWLLYSKRRAKLMLAIVRRRPKDLRFLGGWLNRLFELSAAAYKSRS